MKAPLTFKKIVSTLLIILSIGLLVYDITQKEKKEIKSQLHILATTSIIANVLENLAEGITDQEGKPAVVVHTLMKIGVDPHSYESTIQDAERCNSADVIFVSGLNLEGTMGHIFANLQKLKPVYVATDILEAGDIRKDTRFSSGVDPHFWGDVRLMSRIVGYFVGILEQLDPAHAACYAKNGKIYKEKLAHLHCYIAKRIHQLPAEKRLVITTHDFLGYFAKAYNIQVRALQGFTTAREITLKRRKDLAQTIIGKGIKAIFAETGVSDRGVKSLVESCKIKGHTLHISQKPLYADSIGESGTPAGSYIGMMEYNVNIIIEALI